MTPQRTWENIPEYTVHRIIRRVKRKNKTNYITWRHCSRWRKGAGRTYSKREREKKRKGNYICLLNNQTPSNWVGRALGNAKWKNETMTKNATKIVQNDVKILCYRLLHPEMDVKLLLKRLKRRLTTTSVRKNTKLKYVVVWKDTKIPLNVHADAKLHQCESGTVQNYCDLVWNDTKLLWLVCNNEKPSMIESVMTKNYNDKGLKRH